MSADFDNRPMLESLQKAKSELLDGLKRAKRAADIRRIEKLIGRIETLQRTMKNE